MVTVSFGGDYIKYKLCDKLIFKVLYIKCLYIQMLKHIFIVFSFAIAELINLNLQWAIPVHVWVKLFLCHPVVL